LINILVNFVIEAIATNTWRMFFRWISCCTTLEF